MAGAYVPYDASRRFNILMDREVISVSGSDEHGTPITVRAMKETKHLKKSRNIIINKQGNI